MDTTSRQAVVPASHGMRHKLLIIAAAAILVKLLFFLSAFRGVTESSSSTCERCNYTKDQEMLDWLGGIFGSRTSAYCKHEFPQARGTTFVVFRHLLERSSS